MLTWAAILTAAVVVSFFDSSWGSQTTDVVFVQQWGLESRGTGIQGYL